MSLSKKQVDWSDDYRQSGAVARPSIHQVTMPRVEEYAPPRRRVKSVYRKQANRLPNVFYLVVWAALVFCVLQCVRTLTVEAYKLSVFVKNQPIIERYYHDTVQENRILQDKIKSSSSPASIEAMARNSLNLTGDQEILVHLH